MKKFVLITIAAVFLASPVFASDFRAEQAKELDTIAEQMLQNKEDAAKLDFLIQKNECVERAKDLEGLKVCLLKFPEEKLQAMNK